MDDKRLLEFYGGECPHCIRMKPLIQKVEQELNVVFEKYEVWHNPENAKKMDEYDKGHCGGVPFFYNTGTHKWICGAVPYEQFKIFVSEG
ncbi:MAG: hypothetical protein A2806_03275 [Candidatus Terrybacteria bacterium RIFCSPHIGHO2_01_FULL_48_17]|uniref:Thioredoxin domain-containing protein n=1 Tax=Candidatus Terrybacteria bacterium RIFCSPHIGHO2_01_FULL_48_17 TaxID=1802362 RepID=A0A1G2PGY4_9BACT|nr:MAG: hypothetical protein A2806_03275 [Candidatus Terrybacteria bacterium RIFCSPHIGHO2_01_FULL_48_17]OHA53148.1 MAG: hypothetical protein A3A30_02185 [Candidatus Terrybacteria bacterium RIFCSPLOWO2_01_FULL_48_14]